MSTGIQFYARFDAVRGEEWDSLEYLQSAEDFAELDRFWSEDPGYSEDEKHSAFRAIVDREATDFGSLREWVVHTCVRSFWWDRSRPGLRTSTWNLRPGDISPGTCHGFARTSTATT